MLTIRIARMMLVLSAAVLAVAVGRFLYHYVLFQGTILTLSEF